MSIEPNKAVKAYAVKVVCKCAVCIVMSTVIGRCATYFDSKWILCGLIVPVFMYFGF